MINRFPYRKFGSGSLEQDGPLSIGAMEEEESLFSILHRKLVLGTHGGPIRGAR